MRTTTDTLTPGDIIRLGDTERRVHHTHQLNPEAVEVFFEGRTLPSIHSPGYCWDVQEPDPEEQLTTLLQQVQNLPPTIRTRFEEIYFHATLSPAIG